MPGRTAGTRGPAAPGGRKEEREDGRDDAGARAEQEDNFISFFEGGG